MRLGLGCDNCSGSDVQNVFQAMKMFCLLAAVSEPEPGRRSRTRRSAMPRRRGAHGGLEGKLGALEPGYTADLVLIDLEDPAYLPYNSAARQLVYTETGRGVESVIVDGRVVVQDRKVTTIDEEVLRREVKTLMRHFIADYEAIVASRQRALPYLLEAHRKHVEERDRNKPLYRPGELKIRRSCVRSPRHCRHTGVSLMAVT